MTWTSVSRAYERASRFCSAYLPAAMRRDDNRRAWEHRWSQPNFSAPWLGRGVSREIEAAVKEGWFESHSAALDIGCGEGVVAAWLAEQGFRAVGVDIAPSAVARARNRFVEQPGQLEFHTVDICRELPPTWQYQVLVDRGCYHQLAPSDRSRFLRTLIKVSAHDAKLLLFVRAFRHGQPLGDSAEHRRVIGVVNSGLADSFAIERIAETWLDPFDGERPTQALPGMVLWLTRRNCRAAFSEVPRVEPINRAATHSPVP
ncbi:MAG: SAM-dependent methyltransferase [Planctomycetaceae bacterium]